MGKEFIDIIEENFDDIVIAGNNLGIEITEDCICQSGRFIMLNIIFNAREWIVESSDDGKYILSHMSTAGSRKFNCHLHRSDFISYHALLSYIESSHNPAKRVKTKVNSASFNLEHKLRLVANNR